MYCFRVFFFFLYLLCAAMNSGAQWYAGPDYSVGQQWTVDSSESFTDSVLWHFTLLDEKGEPLAGETVYIGNCSFGTFTDEYGVALFTLPKGKGRTWAGTRWCAAKHCITLPADKNCTIRVIVDNPLQRVEITPRCCLPLKRLRELTTGPAHYADTLQDTTTRK